MESEDDWNRNRIDFEPVDSRKAVKEESIEIKEEPIDDFAEVKHEEPIADTPSFTEGNELSRNPEVKEEPVDVKEEPVDDFADIEQQEPIAVTPSFNEGNELSRNPEVKDEPVDVKDEPVDDVGNVQQADPSIDVHIPASGKSRPLQKFKSSSRSKPKKRRGRPVHDHEIALANGLPFSVAEINETPLPQFREMLKSLSESQQAAMKDIRNRGRYRQRSAKKRYLWKTAATPISLDPTETQSATAEQSKAESDFDEDPPRCELCGSSMSSPIQISLATIVELPDTFHLNSEERKDLCNRAMADPTADVLLCREHFAYAHRERGKPKRSR